MHDSSLHNLDQSINKSINSQKHSSSSQTKIMSNPPPYTTTPSQQSSYQHSDPPTAIDCFSTSNAETETDGLTRRDSPFPTSRKKTFVGLLTLAFFAIAAVIAAVIATAVSSFNHNTGLLSNIILNDEQAVVDVAASSNSAVGESYTVTTPTLPISDSSSEEIIAPNNNKNNNNNGGERVFLHISDTHADPYYDYRHYWESASKISRDPRLYSKTQPAESCGEHSESDTSIFDYWDVTSDPGQTCPCGHFGANPPFSVLYSLADAIANNNHQSPPEFVIWGGDFTSHFEPGTAIGDDCRTAKNAAKASVSILNVRFGSLGNNNNNNNNANNNVNPIQHLWVFGNNDVVPKSQPLTQDWLEEFGQHLVTEEWLTPQEYETKRHGY